MKTFSEKQAIMEEHYLNALTYPDCSDVETKFMDLCEIHVIKHELTWKEVSDFYKGKR